MSETTLNTFTNGVASYLFSCIFPSIVQGFAAKGVTTSVEELLAMTNTPSVRQGLNSVAAMPFNGAVPGMAPAIPPSKRKTNTTTAPVVGRTCTYQFKRGDYKGNFCGKVTSPGNDFCNGCMKTRKNLNKDAAAGVLPGAAPGAGSIPGMAGLPPGYSAGLPTGYAAPVQATPDASQGGQLSVKPYDEERGLYIEPVHGFIVFQVSPGVIAVVGCLNKATNMIVSLTPQEQETARGIGLVINDTVTQTFTAGASIPAVPVAPSFPSAVPSIPSVPSFPNAVPNGIPAIPSVVPSIPNAIPNGIPAIPSVNNMGAYAQTVPAIPVGLPQQTDLMGTGQPPLPIIQPLSGVPQANTPTLGAGTIPAIPQINM